jgi:hypothetical protein
MLATIAWVIGLFCFYIFCSAFAKAQENYEEEKNTRRRKPKVKLAKIADIKLDQPGLEMLINYYAGRNQHWQTGPIDWKTKVYGLGYGGYGHFLIGYSYELGRIRHFMVKSIHKCVDAETGKPITAIVATVKAFNPVMYDMDDYFEELEQYKEKNPDQAREWLNVD